MAQRPFPLPPVGGLSVRLSVCPLADTSHSYCQRASLLPVCPFAVSCLIVDMSHLGIHRACLLVCTLAAVLQPLCRCASSLSVRTLAVFASLLSVRITASMHPCRHYTSSLYSCRMDLWVHSTLVSNIFSMRPTPVLIVILLGLG